MALRLPSVREMLRHAAETYYRFPMTLISAMLFTVSALVLIEGENPWMQRLIFTAILGAPLFMALEGYIGLNGTGTRHRAVLLTAGWAFLLFYAVTFPGVLDGSPEIHFIRFVVLAFAFTLLASYLPFIHTDDQSLFWQYNKSLLVRIVTTVPFTVVLFAGLSVALAAVDNLFSADIDPKWYMRIWVCVAGLFNTWFFLSGVPRSMEEVREDTAYPKALKVFTVNILLPLVLVYVVILYVYTGKIIMEWDWPKGWVGNLVLGFSITGILSLLLVWPMRNDPAMRWIRTFNRFYYLAVIPLSLLLQLAIWRRIDEYGLTENRYFVALLGIWLLVIALYFTLSAVKNIKWIPLSLSLIALATAYGPWSAFSVSERMQLDRLETIIRQHGLAPGVETTGALRTIPFEDNKEICEIARYLSSHFGAASMQSIAPELASLRLDHDRAAAARSLAASLHIPYIHPWQTAALGVFDRYTAEGSSAVAVNGYDLFISDIRLSESDSIKSHSAGEGTIRTALGSGMIIITGTSVEGAVREDSIPVGRILERLSVPTGTEKKGTVTMKNEELTFRHGSEGNRYALFIKEISVGRSPVRINEITFDLLIGRADPSGR
ncbi:MAG: DUF4153 domain-containing protein [Bacteroidetes bacterium]|nr:DUF4153 domain-containing protein [Bacteroidota bacterium]